MSAMTKKYLPDRVKKTRSLFNMEVDAKFREAVKRLRHLDPDVPSAKDVVRRAVFKDLEQTDPEFAKRLQRT